MIFLKRIYQSADRADGTRVLVDGMWPRGVSRSQARLDHWMKAVAPSSGLRRWFGHDPERWDEFRCCYWKELEAGPCAQAVRELEAFARDGDVTLLYAARDQEHNNAVALKEYMDKKHQ